MAAPAGATLAQLDIVRPGFGLVTFPAQDLGGVVYKVGRRWVAETEAGTVVGNGRDAEAAALILADHLKITGPFTVETDTE